MQWREKSIAHREGNMYSVSRKMYQMSYNPPKDMIHKTQGPQDCYCSKYAATALSITSGQGKVATSAVGVALFNSRKASSSDISTWCIYLHTHTHNTYIHECTKMYIARRQKKYTSTISRILAWSFMIFDLLLLDGRSSSSTMMGISLPDPACEVFRWFCPTIRLSVSNLCHLTVIVFHATKGKRATV